MGLDEENYEFREFPLAVSLDEEGKPTKDQYLIQGKRRMLREVVIVNSAQELQELLDGAVVENGKLRTEDVERQELLTQAAECGAKVDGRWSLDKIREKIAERRAEVQADNARKAEPVL